MRDEKTRLNAECKKAVAELDAKMEQLEGILALSLNAAKVNSMGAANGTFYKELETKASCTDWPAYLTWMVKEQAFDGVEKRVGQGFIKTMYETDPNDIPECITVLREHVVRVRKK